MTKRNIKILNSKRGKQTLCIDGMFIHSKYDPLKEAEVFINNNRNFYENKKHIVMYGLGLGYYALQLLKKMNNNCHLYIFDIDEEVFSLCNDKGFLKDLQCDKRVKLYIGIDKFMEQFSRKTSLVEDVLIASQMVKSIPEQYQKVKNLFVDFQLSKIAIKKYGNEMKENYDLNIKLLKREITEFLIENKKDNRPIVIVAAGPSLDLSLSKLKSIRSSVKIFAVGRALRPLMEFGIKPDMICIIDSQELVYKQIKGYENLQIPLCFLSTANNLAITSYKGPRYIFYNDDLGFNTKIDTGKSVATAILDIAIKCNGNPIIFLGQDLAYFDDKYHAENASYGLISNNINKKSFTKEVLSVDGKLLKTTEGLLSFKRWIESKIRNTPKVTFINCSKGAKIEGTLNIQLDELIKYMK